MSSRRRHAALVPVAKLPKGPNGRALCRICGTEVPKGRRSYCSEPCQIDGECMWSGELARRHTHARDRGVCAICGLDTDALAIEVKRLRDRAKAFPATEQLPLLERLDVLTALGFNVSRWSTGALWEMDHIIPVVEGGGECGLGNLRTLCTPCHKQVTRELAARRAAEKRGDDPTTVKVKPPKRSRQLGLGIGDRE